MQLQFLGCGDAFGTGGRFNTCFHVTASVGSFLIDCGATSMVAMRKFGVDPNTIRTIFLTHLHGDHFGGVPFFLLDAQFLSVRPGPLTIAGPPGTEERLRAAANILFPGSGDMSHHFDVDYVVLDAGETTTVNGVDVTPFDVDHNCGAPPYALRFGCDGKSLAYSGDTAWTDELVKVADGVDLMIMEAMAYDKGIPGHVIYLTLKQHLERLNARRIILTHFGPEMYARRSELSEDTPEDGMIVEI